MAHIFETVRPEALLLGDLVEGNGALWRIVEFGKWRGDGGPHSEYVAVECVDPRGVRPFTVGHRKQFAQYPESRRGMRHHPDGGDWTRVKMTGAERERSARIGRYRWAYERANRKDAPGIHYDGRRYRIAAQTSATGPDLDRWSETLERRIATANQG